MPRLHRNAAATSSTFSNVNSGVRTVLISEESSIGIGRIHIPYTPGRCRSGCRAISTRPTSGEPESAWPASSSTSASLPRARGSSRRRLAATRTGCEGYRRTRRERVGVRSRAPTRYAPCSRESGGTEGARRGSQNLALQWLERERLDQARARGGGPPPQHDLWLRDKDGGQSSAPRSWGARPAMRFATHQFSPSHPVQASARGVRTCRGQLRTAAPYQSLQSAPQRGEKSPQMHLQGTPA